MLCVVTVNSFSPLQTILVYVYTTICFSTLQFTDINLYKVFTLRSNADLNAFICDLWQEHAEHLQGIYSGNGMYGTQGMHILNCISYCQAGLQRSCVNLFNYSSFLIPSPTLNWCCPIIYVGLRQPHGSLQEKTGRQERQNQSRMEFCLSLATS